MKRIALRIKAATTLMTVGTVLVTQIFPLQAFAEDIASPPVENVPVISVIDVPSPVPVSDTIAPVDGSFLLPALTITAPSNSTDSATPVVVSEPVAQNVISDVATSSAVVDSVLVEPVADEAAAPTEEIDDEVVDTTNESDIDLYKNFEGVVRQSTPVTCGPASLATLFSQLGDSTTEADVLQYVAIDAGRGVNMLQLKAASEKLNHPAVLKHWSVDQLTAYLTENADPILIHDVKEGVGGHFSVLREVVDGKVTLSDTEAGNITYSLADFAHVYDGYVLIADPDASIAAIADETTNLSDVDAANIWGKYVPVALAASRDGASDAATAFKWCMERALTLSSATIRNNERKGCYIQLGQALVRLAEMKGGMSIDAKIAKDAGLSYLTKDTFMDLNKDAQYSMGSNYGALVDARNAARAAASRANEQYQLDLSRPNPITDSNNVILGKKADLEDQLDTKNAALRAANDQVSKAQLDLGNVKQQISASTSSLASLSRSFQNKLSNLNSQLASKMSKVRSVTQERDSWSAQSASYQQQANALCTNWYTCAKNVFQITALKAKKLYADGFYALNNVLVQRAQQEVNDIQQQINSGGGTSAESSALAALKEKQNTIEDDIARKQARLPGIQNEITTINTAIAKLPALKTVPPPASKAIYDAAALAYANAVQAVADERAFIDFQEKQLDNALTNFVLNGVVDTIMQAPFVRGFGDQVVAFSQLGKDGPIVAAKNIVVGTGDLAVQFVIDVYLSNNLQDQIAEAITVYDNLSSAEQSSVRQYVYGGATFQIALAAVTHGAFKAVSGVSDALVNKSAIQSTIAPVADVAALDSEYAAYVARKTRVGSVFRTRADWEVARNYFVNNVKIARGNAFNDFRSNQYKFNEITLENGKRLDSYKPPVLAEDGTVIKPGEIVSRKATDLGDIELATFKGYLSELKNKYQSGMRVVAGPKSENIELAGKTLEGVQILEIPDSNLSLPNIEEYRSVARDNYGIKLRFAAEK